MTPQQLAERVEAVVERAQERVGPDSIGAQQYYVEGQPQKFETMDPEELIDYVTEEALDLVNYGVMLVIRLDRFRDRIRQLSDDLAVEGWS